MLLSDFLKIFTLTGFLTSCIVRIGFPEENGILLKFSGAEFAFISSFLEKCVVLQYRLGLLMTYLLLNSTTKSIFRLEIARGKYSKNKVIVRYGPKATKSKFYLHLFVVMATNVNVVISQKELFTTKYSLS